MFPTLCKLENLFKVEVLSMNQLLGYLSAQNITEWAVTLPSHIKMNKIISVTNHNLGSWIEYNCLDIQSNRILVGCQGNLSAIPAANIKITVAYFT